ncbi:MAG: PKD domain-containing protein, partial [Methanobacteriota archaeon]
TIDTNVTHYRIYRSRDNTNFVFVAQVESPLLLYADLGLQCGVQYHYRVTATINATEGRQSMTASATTSSPCPPPLGVEPDVLEDYGRIYYCARDPASYPSPCADADFVQLPAYSYYKNGTGGVWESSTLDLSGVGAGKWVSVRFAWTAKSSTSGAGGGARGWFLDDLVVSGTTTTGRARTWYVNYNEFNGTGGYKGIFLGSEEDDGYDNLRDTPGMLYNLTVFLQNGGALYQLGAKTNPADFFSKFESLGFDGNTLKGSNNCNSAADCQQIFQDPNANSTVFVGAPNALNWATYDKVRRTEFTFEAGAPFFDRVLYTQKPVGGGGIEERTLLYLSKQDAIVNNTGVVMKGLIAASSLTPYAMGEREAQNFFGNLILYGVLNNFYLNYGPDIPRGEVVDSAQRIALIDTGREPFGLIELQLVLYVWGGPAIPATTFNHQPYFQYVNWTNETGVARITVTVVAHDLEQGGRITYRYSWGDGTETTSSAPTASKLYPSAGQRTIKVWASDGNGATTGKFVFTANVLGTTAATAVCNVPDRPPKETVLTGCGP